MSKKKSTAEKINASVGLVPVTDLHRNPDNPRTIKDDSFKNLCESIRKFPRMLWIRPIVYDTNKMIIGGDKRFEAAKAVGMTEVPAINASELTEDERRRFIVQDNSGAGDNDFTKLHELYTPEELIEFGVRDIPVLIDEEEEDQIIKENTLRVTVDCLTPESKAALIEFLKSSVDYSYKAK